MVKRTTIEIDQDLLARAKHALGRRTTRETVEEALRLATEVAETGAAARAEGQVRYLERLSKRADPAAMRSESMWR